MKQIILSILLFSSFFGLSQKIKSGNYLYTFGDRSQSIFLYNDSLFDFFETSDGFTEFGHGNYYILNNKMLLIFDSINLNRDSSEIGKILIPEKLNDSIELIFKITDVATKQPIPFILIKIQTEKNKFKIYSNFDGMASIILAKSDTIQNINTYSNLYENQNFYIDSKNSYKIEMNLLQKEETIVNEKRREIEIMKIKSKGLYLNYYGDKRFYRLTY